MTRTIKAHFDGKVIVPDEPVQLPVGQPITVHVEVSEAPFADLLRFAADLPDAPRTCPASTTIICTAARSNDASLRDALTADEHFRQAGFRAVLQEAP